METQRKIKAFSEDLARQIYESKMYSPEKMASFIEVSLSLHFGISKRESDLKRLHFKDAQKTEIIKFWVARAKAAGHYKEQKEELGKHLESLGLRRDARFANSKFADCE